MVFGFVPVLVLGAGGAAAQPAPGARTQVAAPLPAAAPAAPIPDATSTTTAAGDAGSQDAGAQDAPARGDARMSTGVPYATAPLPQAPAPAPGGDGHAAGALAPFDDELEHEPRPGEEDAGSGMLGVVRIDGKGRGFAAGAGLLIARGRLDLEILALRSDVFGGYLGARFRPYAGMFRPYVAAGLPGFVFDHEDQVDGTTQSTKRLAIGIRGAIGLELRIDHHVSAFGDLGFEHFFLSDARFEADLFVPTLGVIGRL